MTRRKHWRQKCISVFLTLLCFCYVQRKTNLLIFQTIITCSWQLKDLPAAVMQNHYCSHSTWDNTAVQHNNSVNREKLKIACSMNWQRNALKWTCLQSLGDELRHIQAKFLKVQNFVYLCWYRDTRVSESPVSGVGSDGCSEWLRWILRSNMSGSPLIGPWLRSTLATFYHSLSSGNN